MILLMDHVKTRRSLPDDMRCRMVSSGGHARSTGEHGASVIADLWLVCSVRMKCVFTVCCNYDQAVQEM